jgi:hypothetical protein
MGIGQTNATACMITTMRMDGKSTSVPTAQYKETTSICIIAQIPIFQVLVSETPITLCWLAGVTDHESTE